MDYPERMRELRQDRDLKQKDITISVLSNVFLNQDSLTLGLSACHLLGL